MKAIKTLGFATLATLALSLSVAMAQESPNDTMSGTTWPPPRVPSAQGQLPSGTIQSGSSDAQPKSANNGWTPGVAY